MIENRIGNLLEQKDLDAWIQSCNCFCTMGSGVAKEVREKYPEVYEADLATKSGDKKKLGTFSFAKTHDGKIGYNLYGQFNYGRDRQHTDYEAILNGLLKIKAHVKENISSTAKIGLPFKMGCVRGGGNWDTVKGILLHLFNYDPMTLVICEFNDYKPSISNFSKQDILTAKQAFKRFELMGNDVENEKYDMMGDKDETTRDL